MKYKKKNTLIVKITLVVFLFFPYLFVFSQSNIRLIENFDFDWKFILEDSVDFLKENHNDSNWNNVQLPHDWSINLTPMNNQGGAMGFYPGGTGWYRKKFFIPANYKGNKIVVNFDGVYHQSDVYINGKHLGFHPYGYTGFEYDLTPYLNFNGENVIAVRVDHSDSPSSRWYSGSGIYRHVWLKVLNPIHIASLGTYVTTPKISKNSAEIKIQAIIKNSVSENKNVVIENQLFDDLGRKVSNLKSSKLFIKPNSQETVSELINIDFPKLWSINSPNMYFVETTIKVNKRVIDQYKTPFGVREIKFDADKGFFLNGENVKQKGVCLHPDAGSLGTAIPDKSYLRRLKILKEYGVNAIRCSHNPPSPEFLDMCDSLGFVVIDEVFDKWKSGYYSKYFDEWWKKDVEAMVFRDRNHPSVILWSIGNETLEQDFITDEGTRIATMLRDYVHQLDLGRLVTAAIRPTDVRNYNKNGFIDSLDVVGYNYQEPWLLEDKKLFPKRIMYVSEAYPYYRGKNDSYKGFDPTNPWYDVAKNEFVFGQFVWAGVDYLGESTGWPSTAWPTGLFDACMFEKPSAAFHRAVWNNEPMVRIAVNDKSLNIDPGKPHWSSPFLISHWNFPQYLGHVIDIQTTTNCEEVELFLNNKSLGKRSISNYKNNTINWNVPYESGIIHAKGYSKGKEVANYELKTSGKATLIGLVADKNKLTADGQDLVHLEIKLLDNENILVPDSDKLITVEVEGNGKLLGLDSGDLRVYALREGNKIRTYFGKALATIQASKQKGEIRIVVKSDGFPDSQIVILNQ